MTRESKTVRGVQTREAGAHDHNIHIDGVSISHAPIMATAACFGWQIDYLSAGMRTHVRCRKQLPELNTLVR
jgi:hypothetical protein